MKRWIVNEEVPQLTVGDLVTILLQCPEDAKVFASSGFEYDKAYSVELQTDNTLYICAKRPKCSEK